MSVMAMDAQRTTLCFIADVGSVHARRWIAYFAHRGFHVHVIGTGLPVGNWSNTRLHLLPRGRAALLARVSTGDSAGARRNQALRWLERCPLARPLRRYRWAVARLIQTICWRRRVRDIITQIEPDLVHAIRLPPEGFLGALSGFHPLVVSSWGNDFTYWAHALPGFGYLTHLTLARADGYIPDCRRDALLARRFGWDSTKPVLINPGSSVDLDLFQPDPGDTHYRKKLNIAPAAPMILSYRGFGLFYNPLTIVHAIPAVLQQHPGAVFVLVGDLSSVPGRAVRAEVVRLGVESAVRWVNRVPHVEIPRLLHAADAMVSVSSVDGVPITLLESMACGVPPVISDLDSIREWVTGGENGLLVDPRSPSAVSQAILRLLNDPVYRQMISRRNLLLVRERGDYRRNMQRVEDWYGQFILP